MAKTKGRSKRPNININVTVEGDQPKAKFFPFWLRWLLIWIGILLILPMFRQCH